MVSLVIPAYNEEKIIKRTVQTAEAYFEGEGIAHEIIVVDDGSRDDTAGSAGGTGSAVIRLPENRGKGAAVRTGMLHATGDFVFFTDADLPYALDFIGAGIEALSHCPVVCGVREGAYPLRRRLVSAAYNKIAQNVLQIGVDDIQCGIKGFTKAAAKRLFSLCRTDGFAFDAEVLFLAHVLDMALMSLPARLTHRARSKVSLLGDGLEMFADIVKIRSGFEAGEYNLRKIYQG